MQLVVILYSVRYFQKQCYMNNNFVSASLTNLHIIHKYINTITNTTCEHDVCGRSWRAVDARKPPSDLSPRRTFLWWITAAVRPPVNQTDFLTASTDMLRDSWWFVLYLLHQIIPFLFSVCLFTLFKINVFMSEAYIFSFSPLHRINTLRY